MLFVGPKECIAVVKLKKEDECKENSIENNIKFNVKHVRIIKFQTTQTLKLMWVSSYCFWKMRKTWYENLIIKFWHELSVLKLKMRICKTFEDLLIRFDQNQKTKMTSSLLPNTNNFCKSNFQGSLKILPLRIFFKQKNFFK